MLHACVSQSKRKSASGLDVWTVAGWPKYIAGVCLPSPATQPDLRLPRNNSARFSWNLEEDPCAPTPPILPSSFLPTTTPSFTCAHCQSSDSCASTSASTAASASALSSRRPSCTVYQRELQVIRSAHATSAGPGGARLDSVPFDSAPSTLLYTELCISHHHMVVDMLIRPPTEDSRNMHLCFSRVPAIIGLLERLIFTADAMVTAPRASASTQFREITLLFGYRDMIPSGSVGDMSHVYRMIGPPRHGPGDLLVTLEKRADWIHNRLHSNKRHAIGVSRKARYVHRWHLDES